MWTGRDYENNENHPEEGDRGRGQWKGEELVEKLICPWYWKQNQDKLVWYFRSLNSPKRFVTPSVHFLPLQIWLIWEKKNRCKRHQNWVQLLNKNYVWTPAFARLRDLVNSTFIEPQYTTVLYSGSEIVQNVDFNVNNILNNEQYHYFAKIFGKCLIWSFLCHWVKVISTLG